MGMAEAFVTCIIFVVVHWSSAPKMSNCPTSALHEDCGANILHAESPEKVKSAAISGI